MRKSDDVKKADVATHKFFSLKKSVAQIST